MGVGPSLDGEIADAKTILADFSAAFAKNYSKCYLIGLMKETKKEMTKAAQGPKWKLIKLPAAPPAPPQKEGMLLKRSLHLKKWNPRYVVVTGTWNMDYYETEAQFTANAKPRGKFNVTGYRVVRDLNDTTLKRLEALAEKCKLDLSAFPKPETFPETAFELFHETKECVLLQAADAAEHKAWCDVFDKARYYGSRFDVHDDKVHLVAFPDALWRTRWEVGMWGWWYSGGGEVAMIADCINDKIMWDVMGRVDEKLTMPWAARSKIRNGFIKNVDTAVTAAVGPMWQAAYEGVKKVRPDVKAKLKDLLGPIVDAQKELQDKIVGMVKDSSKSVLEEKLTPHFAPLLEVVFAPVIESVKGVIAAFDHALEAGREKYAANEQHMYMVKTYGNSREFYDASRLLSALYDPLWDMSRVFGQVSPWGIMYKAQTRVRKLYQNALYTFETRMGEGASWEDSAAETRALMVQDGRASILRILGHVLVGVVEGLWNELVVTPARKLVSPLADAVPDAVKDFVDPNDMLNEVLKAILWGTAQTAFEPFAARIIL